MKSTRNTNSTLNPLTKGTGSNLKLSTTGKASRSSTRYLKKIGIGEKQLLCKKICKDIIEHSILIADFHYNHKNYQKIFENRPLKREINFVTQDSQFIGKIESHQDEFNWQFISRSIGKIIDLDRKGGLKLFNFNASNSNNFSLKLSTLDDEIICSEIYENDETGISYLLILTKNFYIFTIDLHILIKEDEEDIIEKAKSEFFNIKPYLNIPNIDFWVPDLNNHTKIIILPKNVYNNCTNVVLNFTQISSKVLVYNFLSNSVIENYRARPEDFIAKDSTYLPQVKELIYKIFSKIWTLKQYEILKQLIKEILNCAQKDQQLNYYKKLSLLLNLSGDDEEDALSILIKTEVFTFTESLNALNVSQRKENSEKFYSNVLKPIITYNISGNCLIPINTILAKILNIFEKIYECSIAVSKNDFSLIKGKFRIFQILFLKCYNRKINLRDVFSVQDPNNNGYVDEHVAFEVFKNLPIGLTYSDINELLNCYNLYDENNKYMYEYLFLLDEFIITKVVYSSPLNLMGGQKFTCGFFVKDESSSKNGTGDEENKTKVQDITFLSDNDGTVDVKNKISMPTVSFPDKLNYDPDYFNNNIYNKSIEKRGILSSPELSVNHIELIDYIINESIRIEISDIVYLSNSNLMFIITPINPDILIFLKKSYYTNKINIFQKIGNINLNSFYVHSPGFIYYIEERNLLVTQRTSKTSTELILIDINKEIVYKSYDNYIEYNIGPEKNAIKDLIKFEQGRDKFKLFTHFEYLRRNELFVIGSKESIFIINPKSHLQNISLKMQEFKKSVYTNICRNFCENPNEQMGEKPFKILYKIDILGSLKNILTFSLGNDNFGDEHFKSYSRTDWIILYFKTNEFSSYCINQLYITQKAKEIDTPISKQDIEKLLGFSLNQMIKSFDKYKNIYLDGTHNYYDMIQRKKKESINQISLSIKETILYEKLFIMSPKGFQIQNIHQLIKLIKELNLNYDSNIIFEMFPTIQFEKPKFDSSQEYFKYDLFPRDKVYDEVTETDQFNLPKPKMNVISDLSNLEGGITLFDSGIKKIAMFMSKNHYNIESLFKVLDENEEEILDSKQFFEGCENIGLLDNFQYLTKDELKEVFKRMDANNSDVVTLDEFNKFFEKIDIISVLSTVEYERNVRRKASITTLDVEKFVYKSEEEKIKLLSPILQEIKVFYMRYPKLEYNDVKKTMELIGKYIYQEDIENYFIHGVVFKDSFRKFLMDKNAKIPEDDYNKLFSYFDQKNQNFFIYTRDFIHLLIRRDPNCSTVTEYKPNKLTDKEFLLMLIAIFKKLLKLCIITLGLSPSEFTDKFLMTKKVNKNILVMNFMQTYTIKENILRRVTNFLKDEENILFNYYLDVNNYGIVFNETTKNNFDAIMKYINDEGIFDLNAYDTFNDKTLNKYINSMKKNESVNEYYLEKDNLLKRLPIYDNTLLEFAYHTQHKNNMKDLNLLYHYLIGLGEEKDYLTTKEFISLVKDIIPPNEFNMKFAKSLMNQLCENISLINEQKRTVISVPRIVLFILNILKKIEVSNSKINSQELLFCEKDLILNEFNKTIVKFSRYDTLSREIKYISEEYLKLIYDGIFSGLIIMNKCEIANEIKNQLSETHLDIWDHINFFFAFGNDMLITRFNKRLKAINDLNEIDNPTLTSENPTSLQANSERKDNDNDFFTTEIPILKINIKNESEKRNLKRYQSGMIENFDYFQPDLQCIVNVTKIRKICLLQEISKDGQNLLKHIEYSLKANHYLQNSYMLKSKNNKSFDNFQFLRNFGIYTREVTINKRIEEEYYIINEKIDESKYISLYSLIKSNGGLLQIPELANTDMAFYIIRYWGKAILDIIHKLSKISIVLKYFNLKDFYVSYTGRTIKMKNLFTYSFCDIKGNLYSGPDLPKILLLLDQIVETDIEKLSDEKKEEIYADSYISPELIKITNERLNTKVDSWIFGVILFNILFGYLPESFYTQIKDWNESIGNYNLDELLSNPDFNIYDIFEMFDSKFFYNPFLNVQEIVGDKNYFIKTLKLKSFSAVVKKQYLNLATENNNSINGIGIILDLINACLSLDPKKRPSLNSLIHCDLFNFEEQEIILCNKFLSNVINYYSPDVVIKEKMLVPLRGICCEILKTQDTNPLEINNYQNFIFNVIRELNTYLFSRAFSSKSKHSEAIVQSKEVNSNDPMFVNTPDYYFKNSIIAKFVIENKIVDLLIFLVLRHFNINLKLFKRQFLNDIKEEQNYKSGPSNPQIASQIITQKKNNYMKEMKESCGRLINALVDFLYNCVQAMGSYEHVLSLYVENILIWILKLFIGEENQLLSDICDYKNSEDPLKKYILLRTFMRDECIVSKYEFIEDELDKVFSIANSNKHLCEVKSYWCQELYNITIDLFTEAFGENCTGNQKHIVIKNYFTTINAYTKNVANQLENPLINNKINNYLTYVGGNQKMRIIYEFVNTDYVSEILSLIDLNTKLIDKNAIDKEPRKNLEDKRNALNYIYTIFRNHNSYKIRGCLDFKIHFLIENMLFSNSTDFAIKKEVFTILKEISLSLIDMNEISWMFGNNYNKIFEETYKDKTDMLDLTETFGHGDISYWDSNFSLIDFMNKLLIQPHSFVLYFTNKFLGINLKRSKGSYISFMKEFGLIFCSPLCLKPLMRSLMKTNENVTIRQLSLDIIFNLMMSNDQKIISNFNMTMCNFYEILGNIVRGCIQLPKNLKVQDEDDESAIVKANQKFKSSVKEVIKIIIELQNPFIKTQIFNSSTLVKYMEQNNLHFETRLDIEEIEIEFNKIKHLLNFEGYEGKIIFYINTFKCWIFNTDNITLDKKTQKIKNVMNIIHHIFNNEWSQGIKNNRKNCLIFNIVKLFEWLLKNNYHELLFPKDSESISLQLIIGIMNKIRENTLTMKDIVIKINKMIVSKTKGDCVKQQLSKNVNPTYSSYLASNKLKANQNKAEEDYKPNYFGDNSYTLQKVYNFITIKMLNIIYIIFSKNDSFYNAIFNKINFGTLLSELFKVQFDTISLFLNQENIDTSILDNYMGEIKLRIGLFECLMHLSKKYDDIKLQFLKNDFIGYVFKNMIQDKRKFQTEFKKLSLEFLAYKSTYPLRSESISFLNIIFKKYNNINLRTDTDCFIYDEIIRNVKVHHLVPNELSIIKKLTKGEEILSILTFFNMVISNDEREILKIMSIENAKETFEDAIKKDAKIKKLFPFIVNYVSKSKINI